MFNIAKNTFKEIVRNKFLYLIVFFAIVFIIFSLALWKLTIWESSRVIVDFGIAMIEIFGLIGVLFVGSQLLFREVEGKTIFLILSKPISRKSFILWKYFGFAWVITILFLIEVLLYLWVLFIQNIPFEWLIFWALIFTLLKLLILLGLVFFFSSFISPILTILISVMVYLLSHSFSLLLILFSRISDGAWIFMVKISQLLFPPLEALNIKDHIGSFDIFSPSYFVFNSFYAIAYIIVLLFFTVLIFSHKNFED